MPKGTPDVVPTPLPRAFHIMLRDVERHGRTAGCPACDYFERYGKFRSNGRHTDKCRACLIEAINDEAQSGQTIPERDSGLEEDDADDTTPSKTQGF